MIPISKIKFNDLKNYLESQFCFGFLVSRRKHAIIYTFERYLPSKSRITAKIKVMRKTKYVMSVIIKDVIYTDFDKLKKTIEK